jgi:hypothetical protein
VAGEKRSQPATVHVVDVRLEAGVVEGRKSEVIALHNCTRHGRPCTPSPAKNSGTRARSSKGRRIDERVLVSLLVQHADGPARVEAVFVGSRWWERPSAIGEPEPEAEVHRLTTATIPAATHYSVARSDTMATIST